MTLSINSWLYRVTQDTCDLTKSDYIDEETDQQKDTFYNDNENDNGNFCKEIIFCDTHDNSWHCETQMMTSMKTESDPEQPLQSLAMFGQASVSSTFLIRLVSLLPVRKNIIQISSIWGRSGLCIQSDCSELTADMIWLTDWQPNINSWVFSPNFYLIFKPYAFVNLCKISFAFLVCMLVLGAYNNLNKNGFVKKLTPARYYLADFFRLAEMGSAPPPLQKIFKNFPQKWPKKG